MASAVPTIALFETTGWIELGLPALAAALALLLLAHFAPVLGLSDRGGGHGLHREPDGHARSMVGGLALGIGLVFATALATGKTLEGPAERTALVLALLVGLVDDRSRAGLRASTKFGLQALPALAIALAAPEPLFAWFVPCLAAGLAAQNLANTYDNADGVLLASTVLALAPSRPAWSLVALVVLAFNLRWRARANVILGDSGSHLIALMLLFEPRSWGVFFLPALDLARVFLVRRAQRRAWWIGDRSHLAHRLAARGFVPGVIAMTLALAALPAIAAGAFAHGILQWSLGLAGSAAAFVWLVRATPPVDGHGAVLRVVRSGLQPANADREQ